MYGPKSFVVDDVAALHGFIRSRAFATLAVIVDGAVQFAYAPVVLDADDGQFGTLRFHLARANPLAALSDGASVRVSFAGPDAYISPDWYESEGLVPTWNYIATEGAGVVRRLEPDGLRQLLIDLSAAQEDALRPKTPWTIGKVPQTRLAALMNAIVGFSLRLEKLAGKFKLSQDKSAADFEGALRGLEARGDAKSLAVAAAMRRTRS
jgi:transcriptional regulator